MGRFKLNTTIPKRIDLKVGFKCNNLCYFCPQGHKRDIISERPTRELVAELVKARKHGVSQVVFTGGEPTLHRDIIYLVSESRRLGFSSIQLQTNARTLAYMSFLKQLSDAGATEIGPSIHGAVPDTHEKQTRANGSFSQTIMGIKNAVKLGLSVITNTVITTLNYKELPDIAKLLVNLGVNQYQFAFIHIVGTAWENKELLVPKKTQVIKYVHKGLDIGIKAKIKALTEAIPYCFMKGYEDCISEKIIPEGPVSDFNLYVENFGEYRRTEGKIKGPDCPKCKYFKVCEGPWKEYPQMFGWKEFKPVM